MGLTGSTGNCATDAAFVPVDGKPLPSTAHVHTQQPSQVPLGEGGRLVLRPASNGHPTPWVEMLTEEQRPATTPSLSACLQLVQELVRLSHEAEKRGSARVSALLEDTLREPAVVALLAWTERSHPNPRYAQQVSLLAEDLLRRLIDAEQLPNDRPRFLANGTHPSDFEALIKRAAEEAVKPRRSKMHDHRDEAPIEVAAYGVSDAVREALHALGQRGFLARGRRNQLPRSSASQRWS